MIIILHHLPNFFNTIATIYSATAKKIEFEIRENKLTKKARNVRFISLTFLVLNLN